MRRLPKWLVLLCCMNERPDATHSLFMFDPPAWVVIHDNPTDTPYGRWVVRGSDDSGYTWTLSPVVNVDQRPAFGDSYNFWYQAAYVNDCGRRGPWSKVTKNHKT